MCLEKENSILKYEKVRYQKLLSRVEQQPKATSRNENNYT